MLNYTDEELAALLQLLPPAPEAWVAAAKELPRTRQELDRLLPMIEHDAKLREAMNRDLESALRQAGFEPQPQLVAALRRRLAEGDSED